jgi:hypothetical protein
MTTTEEIIVSGENFIERRIILYPGDDDIENLKSHAYGRGYHCGWVRGFLMGMAVIGVVVLCLWLAVHS